MKRRQFISRSAAGLAGSMVIPSIVKSGMMNITSNNELPRFSMRALTHGPKHHFFGYYGMSPWNRSETTMVCLESSFQNRMPNPGEKATIGLVNPANGDFKPITDTDAWNLQQGSLIHWNPLNPDKEFIYNDRSGDNLESISINIVTGNKTKLTRPISAVAEHGKYALSLTYGRLSRLRKVVGYANAVDPYEHEAHPKKDGVYLMDLKAGKNKLVVSIAEVFEKSVGGYPALADRHMWFNHTVINPSATKFLFLARSKDKEKDLDSAMFTANMDGSDLKMVIPFGSRVSHFGWRNDEEIIATFYLNGRNEMNHILFNENKLDYRIVGENFLVGNGHCTYAHGGRFMATDFKDKATRSQSLWFYDMKIDQGLQLCSRPAYEKIYITGNMRCDFHPRWNPAGNKICFDAIDPATKTRQMHLVEFLDI